MPERPLLSRLLDALELAAEKHRLQRRSGYDGLPYINHLIKVSRVIAEVLENADDDTIIASVLHDIIEDTDVTEAYLAERFNPKVASIVAELSDDMSLPADLRKKRQREGAPHLSPEAGRIRVADKGCNLLDIMNYPVAWPMEKKRDYLLHALDIEAHVDHLPPELRAWFRKVCVQAWERFKMEGSIPPRE